VQDKCRQEMPPLIEDTPGHQFRCWFPVDVSVAPPQPTDRPAADFEAGTGRLDQAAPKQKLFEPRPTAGRDD
jgi:hypothetical protein